MEEVTRLKQRIDPTRNPMSTQVRYSQCHSNLMTHPSPGFPSDGGFAGFEESPVQFPWLPETTHEEGKAQKEIQDLSLTLSSQLGSAKFEELRGGNGGSVLNNQGSEIGFTFGSFSFKNFAADHLKGKGHVEFSSGSVEVGNYYGFRNSRYLKAVQELWDEIFCISPPNTAGITFATPFSSNDQPLLLPLAPAAKSEYQRRKVKLRAMLVELEERYRGYREKMQALVNSFESVTGIGSARAYTALARRAMSRHFRCLKDAITAQLKLTCELLGEKGVAGNSRLTKGKAPRLRANLLGVIEETRRRSQRRALGSASTFLSSTDAVSGAGSNDNDGTTKDLLGLTQTQKQPWQEPAVKKKCIGSNEFVSSFTHQPAEQQLRSVQARPRRRHLLQSTEPAVRKIHINQMETADFASIGRSEVLQDNRNEVSEGLKFPVHGDHSNPALDLAKLHIEDMDISTGSLEYEESSLMEDLDLLHKLIESHKKGQSLLASELEFLRKMKDTLSESREKEILQEIILLAEFPRQSSTHTSTLQVLDLSYTSINSLPQSISILATLKKFILKCCDLLMELPPEIGELVNLEVLDLEGTKLICLPKEIGNLIKLTCLRVSIYERADQFQVSKRIKTIIPRRALSNLLRLQELSIDVLPDGDWWDAEIKTIARDLFNLKELKILRLYFPTIELLKNLKWAYQRNVLSLIYPHLLQFRFIVGHHKQRFLSRVSREVRKEFDNLAKLEKGLNYINGECLQREIISVLKYANALFLDRHWTLKSLSEFGTRNMDNLKFCLLVDCNELQTVIDTEQFHRGIELSCLQYLRIFYMKKMESICQGPVGEGCLLNLKSLSLYSCISLTIVFTLGMLSNLKNLEEVIIEDCPKVNSLVCIESSNLTSGNFLPSLKKMSLHELPELVNISNGICIAPKLERMVIFCCPMLEKLSITEVSSQDLKVLKGETEWWDALKWHQSDLGSGYRDYLAQRFIPLHWDRDMTTQLAEE